MMKVYFIAYLFSYFQKDLLVLNLFLQKWYIEPFNITHFLLPSFFQEKLIVSCDSDDVLDMARLWQTMVFYKYTYMKH